MMNDVRGSADAKQADREGEPSANGAPNGSAVQLALHEDFHSIEAAWRDFEQHGDGTVFQAFDWLSTWHKHIGIRSGAQPVIAVGRRSDGEILFLIPLMVEVGTTRRLTWLGSDLCDYNAPLLAASFSDHVGAGQFPPLWRDIRTLVQGHPHLQYDFVDLEKMPERVGAQPNPFLQLRTSANASGAYVVQLSGSWDEFYASRRSASRRKADRNRTRRLADHGELQLITPGDADDIRFTVEKLFEQKSWSFARMGVCNLFTRPGYREFFLDLATNPATRHLVRVSRLQVGSIWAAINLALTFRGSYYHVLCSYERRAVSPFGPGSAHLRELLRYALERGLKHFDFTIGDEPYKLEWSDKRINLHDHVAPATPRGWPRAAATLALRGAKRTIKQTPLLWRAFRTLRSTMAARTKGE